ncbi:MAG: DNA polymerase III subunit delta' [Acetobacteraceae bacterium]
MTDEADQPAVPEPRRTDRLVGHGAAVAAFARAWASGRVHHAWLLCGPPGIGKATLAYRIARFVLAGGEGASPDLGLAPSVPVFRKVASGSHPDLAVLERAEAAQAGRARAEITVDEVRALSGFLRRTPAEGGWRVGLVDPADALNREAANALLKILEEPPPRTLLLLVANAPGRLLVTLRSRCRRLPLEPLAEAEVARLLASLRPDVMEAQRRAAARLARGSVGRALALLGEDEMVRLLGTGDLLAELREIDTARAHAIAGTLSRPGADHELALFLELLRDAVAARARAAALERRASPDAGSRPLEDWGGLWESLGRLADRTVALSLDRKQAVLTALASLRRGTGLDAV